MDAVSPICLRFDEFMLDLARCALRRGVEQIPLRPKSFDVLRYLAESRGRVVSKDELIQAVWPGIFVTDDSLVQCVKEIRQALGDDEHRIIKTVQRRGYLFAAQVTAMNAEPLAQPAPRATTAAEAIAGGPTRTVLSIGWSRLPLPLVAGVLTLLAASGSWLLWEMVRPPATGTAIVSRQAPRPSVAVLPFANLSGDSQQEYFSDGVTEDIINSLSRFSGLFVIARSSSFAFKGTSVPAPEAAQRLRVRYILEGTVQRSGDRVRVTTELVDAESGANRWADRFDRPLTEIFAVQDEITQRIVATLIAQISKAEVDRALHKNTPDLGAYDYYLRGRELRLSYTREDTEEAVRLLEKAISLDAKFAPAYVELGHAYRTRFNIKWGSHPEQDLQRAAELAQRAVILDATLSSAHALLGSVYVLQRRFDEALAANEKAIALNPNDAYSYSRLGVALTRAGRVKEAIETMQTAIRLDPFHPPVYLFYLGRAYYLVKEYERASAVLKRCTEQTPDFFPCRGWLASSFGQVGRLTEAQAEVAHMQRLRPGVTVQKLRRDFGSAYQPQDFDHYLDGIRKAGLPDSGS